MERLFWDCVSKYLCWLLVSGRGGRIGLEFCTVGGGVGVGAVDELWLRVCGLVGASRLEL